LNHLTVPTGIAALHDDKTDLPAHAQGGSNHTRYG
jgi:hypothetical protein